MTYKKMPKIAIEKNNLNEHDFSCENIVNAKYDTHDKQEILTNAYKKMPKNANEQNKKYECNKCFFSTYNKYNYNTHLSTKKHLKNNENDSNSSDISNNIPLSNQCKCGKAYKHRQSLYTN